MKITIIGAGAAGSVIASFLKLGGADVYLVDLNTAHMDKVAAEGMHFIEKGNARLITGFHTSYTPQFIEEMDIIIIMVKALHTENVIRSIYRDIGENTVVVSLQNGLGNEQTLRKYVPEDRIIYGFGTIGTELPEPGFCISKPELGVNMHYGPLKDSELSRAAGEYLQQCFLDGGCKTRFEEDVRPYLWKKAISSSAYNTLSALMRMKVGPMIRNEDGMELIQMIWKEGCEVAKAVIGIDLWPTLQSEFPRLRTSLSTYYPSMAQYVLFFQRQTEIRQLNGAIADYGAKYGIPTPLNTALTHMVTCIEDNYDALYVKRQKF